MKTITEIQKIGKGARYRLYLNGEFYGIFEAEILAKHCLKSGESFEDDFFEDLKIENGDFTCFDKGLSILEKGAKSEKMLRDYLKGKGYPKECIQRACEKLKSYGYIDDQAFCENYISIYKDIRSRRKLKLELLGKGIGEDLVEDMLEDGLDDDESEKCLNFAIKFMKNREKDIKNKQKMFNHLASKGFEYSDIANAWRKIVDDRD